MVRSPPYEGGIGGWRILLRDKKGVGMLVIPPYKGGSGGWKRCHVERWSPFRQRGRGISKKGNYSVKPS